MSEMYVLPMQHIVVHMSRLFFTDNYVVYDCKDLSSFKS